MMEKDQLYETPTKQKHCAHEQNGNILLAPVYIGSLLVSYHSNRIQRRIIPPFSSNKLCKLLEVNISFQF